jgi:F-type H+-transporting ATPase subunit delta
MNEGLIPGRYAKALLKFAVEKHQDARLYELMTTLVAGFEQQGALDATISNPFIAAEKKLQLLATAAGSDKSDEAYLDFLKLLRQNNRLALTRQIALAYINGYRKANNIYRVEVTSAAPMDAAEDARLKKLISSHLGGGSMEYVSKIDPSLIGGFSVNIGSEKLDASVKNELKQLQLRLLGH